MGSHVAGNAMGKQAQRVIANRPDSSASCLHVRQGLPWQWQLIQPQDGLPELDRLPSHARSTPGRQHLTPSERACSKNLA